MNEPKYQISNPHENQKFSGEVFRLVDKSKGTTKTDCIDDFLKFLQAHENVSLYASPTCVKAFQPPYDCYTTPIAILELTTHPRLKLLLDNNRKSLSLKEAEELLRRLRDGLDVGARSILHQLRDLKIVKNLQMEQKKETNGNFSFAVKMESGVGDWIPAEKIEITVPFFNFVGDVVSLPFDFSVELVDLGEGKESKQSLTVKLECLDIEEHLLNGRREILLKNLAASSFPAMWGSLAIEKQNDAWSVVHNHAEGLQRLPS